nr:ribosomal protein S14 [Jatropha curcas]WFG81162.1 ribosomal protein S14 [Jatropha curcas]
MMGIKKSSW